MVEQFDTDEVVAPTIGFRVQKTSVYQSGRKDRYGEVGLAEVIVRSRRTVPDCSE